MRRALLLSVLTALALILPPPAQATAQTWANADFGGVAAAQSGFGTWVFAHGGEVFIGSPGWYPLFPILPSRPGLVAAFGPDNHSGMGFGQYQTLNPSEGSVGDGFGSVIAVDGDRMLVAAPSGADGAGIVYRFVRGADLQSWESAGEPIRAEGADGGGFGSAVALSTGMALVGAPNHDEMTGGIVISGPNGRTLLQPETPVAGERFGASISVNGDWMAVGAPGPDLGALAGAFGGQPQFQPGAVYIFRMDGDAWVETARISEPDLGPSILGASVALGDDGDLFAGAPLAGGAKGEIRHFRMQDDGSWEKVGALTTEIPAQGFLGQTLAFNGDRVAAGAPLGDIVGVWSRTADGTWAEEARLTPDVPGGFFGVSVAMTNTSIWVARPGRTSSREPPTSSGWRAGSGWPPSRSTQPRTESLRSPAT